MKDYAPKEGTVRPRREVPPVKVWVTDDEKSEVAERAVKAGLSMSAYLLTAGLNHETRSVLDLHAVKDLVQVNGDLGRVAGLLKLWLAEKRGEGAPTVDVNAMMSEFRELQGQVRAIMSKVVYERKIRTAL